MKPLTNADELPPLHRWRLILGQAAEGALGGLGEEAAAADAALDWLYGRDTDLAARDERTGGWGPSVLSVPSWIDTIHQLFPKETIERLEQDAVDRYQIEEVVTNPQVLERIQPSEALLAAVLRTKHLMNPEVLALARKLVAEVVRQLIEKLSKEIRAAFAGTIDRRKRTLLKHSKTLDFQRTLRLNLRHYDPATRRLAIERPWFYSRTRRHLDRWQIILLVDQSGSMVSSVIHAAVTAGCLYGLPGVQTHLVAFDTEVVDLTKDASDPVELLMKVQLGGGTDIARAVLYGADLIERPRQAIVVLISDFFEGGSPEVLVRAVAALCGQGTRVLGLAALDDQAIPSYDRDLAQRLVNVGAKVGAMTPGQLANWVAEQMR